MASPAPSSVYGGMDQLPSADLIEGCIGALQALSRDPVNRELIRNIGSIPIGVQLLHSPDEDLQRSAAGLLSELASDKEGATLIEQHGATEPLTCLLASKNDAVSAYAAAVLFKMSEGKPADYRKQLNTELTHSLYRDHGNGWPTTAAELDAMAAHMSPEPIYQPHIYGHTMAHDANNIYQGIYESRQTIQAMSPVHNIYGTTTLNGTLPMDQSNDYSTYGHIPPLQPQHSTNQGWYDSDL